ncbi:hypothetical protein TraAM80_10212 [Trypanosoma rangeli]|uniref:Uncharacterized protein n=1 Tax=Trypanosoma rangeli TaxID=5698 RepID=A0A422MQJ8_TRYRA|nr:uncharacterized protein TraAM80_10212 [Trypanosoma rangeli]RNE95460.1 hypothetical protein TraAM80_10212 [Trypanosoma rangeli]|eukprot:RNE95460.1 hypothetical protein TraAM80_10212 [Trypanosoma rangeli]
MKHAGPRSCKWFWRRPLRHVTNPKRLRQRPGGRCEKVLLSATLLFILTCGGRCRMRRHLAAIGAYCASWRRNAGLLWRSSLALGPARCSVLTARTGIRLLCWPPMSVRKVHASCLLLGILNALRPRGILNFGVAAEPERLVWPPYRAGAPRRAGGNIYCGEPPAAVSSSQ